MTQIRRTVSLSKELDANLSYIATARSESLSALLEMLLREHPLVKREIENGRLEDSIEDFGLVPRKGSPMRELMERAMKQAAASGEAPPKKRRSVAAQPE